MALNAERSPRPPGDATVAPEQPAGTDAAGSRRPAGGVLARLHHAWPWIVVVAVFLAQRLLTVAFVAAVDHGRCEFRVPGSDHLQRDKILTPDQGAICFLTQRWDAGWYARLAQGGYVYPNVVDGHERASNLAYFPLYPWLSRWVSDTGLLSLENALLVLSWVGGILGAVAVYAVGTQLYSRWTGVALAALWGMAPASLALTMAYPEGMFTAAAGFALWFLLRRRPVWAGGCALVAGLMRPSAAAVVVMVWVYALVELVGWVRERRRGEDSIRSPGRAVLGAVLAPVGLAGFMVYVGVRTGQLFGYFAVQDAWGQRSAGLIGYSRAIERGLFTSAPPSLIPVTLAACLVYVLLFCLILPDRRLVWATVYAAAMVVLNLDHTTFQHAWARRFLPAFVLLIPLARMRVPKAGAITALVVGSVVMAWASAHFLLTPGAGI